MNNRDEEIRQCMIRRMECYSAYNEARLSHPDHRLAQKNIDILERRLRDAEFELSNVEYKCDVCSKSGCDLVHDKQNKRWLCFPCNGYYQVQRANEVKKYQDQVKDERSKYNFPPEYSKCDKCGGWSDDCFSYGENGIMCSECCMNEPSMVDE